MKEDEGEKVVIDAQMARIALMACRRHLDREFPNSAAVLAAFIDCHGEALRKARAEEREKCLACLARFVAAMSPDLDEGGKEKP